MTRVVHGIVHGKTIQVTEDLGLLDGQAVELIVTAAPAMTPSAEGIGAETSWKTLPGPPPGWRPARTATSAGLLADEWTEEDDRTLERIQAERKGTKWRDFPE